MDIQKPRRFETTDRAHADLFNEVIDQLNENDNLIGQRAEEAEKNAKDFTDQHVKNKNNPHNVTSEQVNIINELAEDTPLSSYPNGYSMMAGTEKNGYHSYTTVLTYKIDQMRGTQMMMAQDKMKPKIRYWNGGSSWTAWVELESADDAQGKVDAHANDNKLHITGAERTKWNNGQLYKLTSDTGIHKLNLSDKDILEELKNARTVTFYSNSTTVNNPAQHISLRGLQIGQDNVSEVIALGNDGSTWRTTQGNGTFKEWTKLETEAGAQQKATKALNDAKSYADTNFTNQKLTVLTDSDAIQDATVSGDTYPNGITLMNINNNQTGYPLGYGLIKNEKWSNFRFTQYFYGLGNQLNTNTGIGTWVRHWYTSSGWTTWEKISGFAHANVSTNGKQALTKGAINKIEFNRIIKDSHNLFDTSKNRFTASHSGVYLIGTGVYMDNSMNYCNFELIVYLNGSRYKNIGHYRIPTPANTASSELNVGVYGSCTVPMNPGDYVEIHMYVNYNGDEQRYIADRTGQYNYFDILELGGINY
ncbi:terminase [Bacillus swezeyi]|uniref:terminase n=1 Tax=Bacillus swezeyi TaxID=1925020 RepID=UPI002E247F47|nr:terminase [Bacillus swezeyi]